MVALYAFFRLTDDLADEPGEQAVRRVKLDAWERALESCVVGQNGSSGIHPALADAVRRFAINPAHLRAVIAGVRMDLDPLVFETDEDRLPYLDRVASAVGLACLPVWGIRPGTTDEMLAGPARAAGRAFQRTNILRDLGEDAANGRCYLPTDDLTRLGVPWPPTESSAFRKLMTLEIDRAEADYRAADKLPEYLGRDGRTMFGLMCGVYRKLLQRIASNPSAVLTTRVRVSKATKMRLLTKAWLKTWGPA